MKRWAGEAEVVANRSLAPTFHELRFRVPAALDPAGGQFVMIRARRPGRDPLLSRAYSVYDCVSGGDGTTDLAILFRVHGKGTVCLSTLAAGDRVQVVAPLGRPFMAPPSGEAAWLVAGGVGFPPLMSLADGLPDPVCFFYGARAAAELVGLERLDARGIEPVISTEDDSRGHAGRITEPLAAALAARPAGEPAHLYACGPLGLLRAVGALGRRLGLPTQLSFEARMACGVGVCRGCALPRPGGGYLMCCTDGPALPAGDVALDRVSY